MTQIFKWDASIRNIRLWGQGIWKVFKWDGQIRPTYIPPINYHVIWDFTQWSAPSWWDCYGVSFTADWITVGSWESYWMVVSTSESAQNPFPSLSNAKLVVMDISYECLWNSWDRIQAQFINWWQTVVVWLLDDNWVWAWMDSGSIGQNSDWAITVYTEDIFKVTLSLKQQTYDYEQYLQGVYSHVWQFWTASMITAADVWAIRGINWLAISFNWSVCIKSIDVYVYIDDEPVVVTTPWIYHNASLGLISLSDANWENRVTIADKNLWASKVYDPDDPNPDLWYCYQWWNNCPDYSRTWWTDALRDASSYWPNQPFYSTTWTNPNWWNWDDPVNDDLWWWETWTKEAMRWPCPPWFNIWDNSVNQWAPNGSQWTRIGYNFNSLYANSSNYLLADENDNRRSATADIDTHASVVCFGANWSLDTNVWMYKTYTSNHIRPIKNTPVIPDSSWTPLYQLSN